MTDVRTATPTAPPSWRRALNVVEARPVSVCSRRRRPFVETHRSIGVPVDAPRGGSQPHRRVWRCPSARCPRQLVVIDVDELLWGESDPALAGCCGPCGTDHIECVLGGDLQAGLAGELGDPFALGRGLVEHEGL